MKLPKKQEQIRKRVLFWAEKLCCNEIDLTICFKKFAKEEKKDDGDFKTQAYVEFNARYMEATIYINEEMLHTFNDECIVHELIHIKLGELSGYLYANQEEAAADKWKGYFEERFASQFAKIITRL